MKENGDMNTNFIFKSKHYDLPTYKKKYMFLTLGEK